MDSPLTNPPEQVAIDRCDVQNSSAPIRGRGRSRTKSAWDAFLGDKDRFEALVQKIESDNKNLLSRPSKSARRKQRSFAADEAREDAVEQTDTVQASRKAILRAGQPHNKIVETKKRKRGLEPTTEELGCARESFKKPPKTLRTTAPIASSSATRLDTASSITTQLDISYAQMDDNEDDDDGEYRQDLKLMYSRAQIERPECGIEFPDEMHGPALTRDRFMLSVYADEKLEAKLQVDNGLYICDMCTRDHPESEPHDFKSRSHLTKHMVVQHTEWKNLFRDMITESGSFKCPAADCNYKGETKKQAQVHMLQKCRDKEQYNAIKATHDKINAEYFKAVPQ